MAPPNLDNSDTNYTILPTSEEYDKPALNGGPPTEQENLVPRNNVTIRDEDVCSDDIEVVVPPDGGWGWVVVFASFMCNVVVDGTIFSYATFLEEITVEFEVTKARAALVGSLMSGFYLIVGPFASAIANKFGFRLVAILGALLGATAFAVSSLATSVEFLCVTYGLLGGIGFGFIYVPSSITVGFYFEKWRPLATGIGGCGSGIGAFLFAPLTSTLIKALGWRNALLVQGGIVLSCSIFGFLFRPLKPTKLKDLNIDEEQETRPGLPEATLLKMEEALKKTTRNGSLSRIFQSNNNADHLHLSDVYHTIHHIPSTPYQSVLPQTEAHQKEKRLSVPFMLPSDKPPMKRHALAKSHGEEMNRPLYREDIFFDQNLARLPQYTSQSSVAYNLAVTRLPPKEDILEEKSHSCKLYPEAVKRALATMFDFSLLKSPTFIILALGGFFTMMGFYVPFFYIVDRAKEHMAADTAVLLISCVGISNTVGRVLCGILSSFPSVNALLVTNVALTIGGVATILSGVSLTQEYQFFYTVVFGLSVSCFAVLRSIIVVDLLGLERLTNAFGLLLFFQGVATTIGSPLAGAFKDITGSYDSTFYLSGGVILLSAVMCYPLNWVNKWENRRKHQTTANEA